MYKSADDVICFDGFVQSQTGETTIQAERQHSVFNNLVKHIPQSASDCSTSNGSIYVRDQLTLGTEVEMRLAAEGKFVRFVLLVRNPGSRSINNKASATLFSLCTN